MITALSWWICSFAPIQNIVTLFLKDKSGIVEQLLYKVLTCAKCNGFWLGMLMFHCWNIKNDLFYIDNINIALQTIMFGAIISVLSELTYRKLQ